MTKPKQAPPKRRRKLCVWPYITPAEAKTLLKLLEKTKLVPGFRKRLAHEVKFNNSKKALDYRLEAQRESVDGELEIDDDAAVHQSPDPGAYVQAWLWVDDAVADDEDEG